MQVKTIKIHLLGLNIIAHYSATLNFGVLPLVEIDHVTRQCLSSVGAYQSIVPVFGNFRSKFSVIQ